MGLWHKIRSWFSRKPDITAGWYKKVVRVRGEKQVGFLRIDCGTFDENDNPVPIAGETIDLPIPASARASVNRVLAGYGTEDDAKVIEILLAQNL
mgnify:CR=1 FL=1